MTARVGPSGMPRLRAGLLDTLDRTPPAPRLPAVLGMPEPVWAPRIAARRASLYWVSEDMTDVATAAEQSLPWDAAVDAPSTVGLLVWARPLVEHLAGIQAGEVSGVLWWHEHGTWWLLPLTSLDPVGVAVPIEMHVPGGLMSPLRTARMLATTWALMQQPIAVQRTIDRAGPSRSGHPAARGPAPVTIINLRPALRAPAGKDGTGATSRDHHVRWLVRGHWRQQPVGEGGQQRRLTWVTPHVKGPEGAPLRTDRVHVWRR